MPLHSYLQPHTLWETWGLLLWAGVFGLFMALFTFILHRMRRYSGDEGSWHCDVVEVVQTFCAARMGWCLSKGASASLYLAARGVPPPSALFVMAMIITTACLSSILLLDVLMDRYQV